jgi:DDE superfamily endonuclease
MIRDAGAHLMFLPPYSPDLNPSEHVFAKINLMRRAMEPLKPLKTGSPASSTPLRQTNVQTTSAGQDTRQLKCDVLHSGASRDYRMSAYDKARLS